VVRGFAVGTSNSFDIVQLGVGNWNFVGVEGKKLHPPASSAMIPSIPHGSIFFLFIEPPRGSEMPRIEADPVKPII
jgi:hypothetical protein